MKKRVLSALLALSTLLTTAPAAYAAEPATQSDGAEIDWPEPTCTVDYTPQSDTVSCEFVEETGDAPAKLVYTIQELSLIHISSAQAQEYPLSISSSFSFLRPRCRRTFTVDGGMARAAPMSAAVWP